MGGVELFVAQKANGSENDTPPPPPEKEKRKRKEVKKMKKFNNKIIKKICSSQQQLSRQISSGESKGSGWSGVGGKEVVMGFRFKVRDICGRAEAFQQCHPSRCKRIGLMCSYHEVCAFCETFNCLRGDSWSSVYYAERHK